MLTRDLLRTRQVHDRILPAFIKEGRVWSERIGEILAIHRAHVGLRHEELKEALMGHTEAGTWEGRVCKGLCQLLEKEVAYEDEDSTHFMQRRQDMFTRSTELLRHSPPGKIENLFAQLEVFLPARELELYGDLPKLRQIQAISDTTPRQLIRDYNLALAAGLVQQASKIVLEANPAVNPNLPALVRCLKWSGLNLVSERPSESAWRLTISCDEDRIADRPRHYRAMLAELVGLVPHLAEFRLGARLESGAGNGWLVINSDDRLHSPYAELPVCPGGELRNFIKSLDETLRSYGYKPQEDECTAAMNTDDMPNRRWLTASGREVSLYAFQANQGEMLARHMSRHGEGKAIVAVDKQLSAQTGVRDFLHFAFNKTPNLAAFMRHLSARQML